MEGKVEVDRTLEFAGPDNDVLVTLEDGFTVSFWVTGLTDEEYVYRARKIHEIETC